MEVMIAMMVLLKDTSGTIVLFETIGGPPMSNHGDCECMFSVSLPETEKKLLSPFNSVAVVSCIRSRESNRPLPSSKNPHFQNEARCTTFLVKMSFICMRIKNDFHIKG